MAEVINTNVFDATKKFVDFAGLDYFWEKAKAYVDGVDSAMSNRVLTLENTVGDSTKGLVKDVKSIQDELNSLSGGAGSIASQINNAISALNLPNTYDAKGAAAQALEDAKADAAGLYQVKGNYETAGTAAELDAAMDARVKVLEAIDHDKLAADASAAAVATVLDGAPEKFDTLKEVAQWIADSESAATAADLVTRVSALEAIDHEAYVDADTALENSVKSYVDGRFTDEVTGKFDTVGAAAQALADAKADAASLYQVKGNYETVGAAAQALADAKADAASLYQVKGNYETAGAAAQAQAAAIAQAKLDAADALKAYYTKTEVDNLLTTNSTGDRAYAKQYTDELFGSFKFAANSDIDALFA